MPFDCINPLFALHSVFEYCQTKACERVPSIVPEISQTEYVRQRQISRKT